MLAQPEHSAVWKQVSNPGGSQVMHSRGSSVNFILHRTGGDVKGLYGIFTMDFKGLMRWQGHKMERS